MAKWIVEHSPDGNWTPYSRHSSYPAALARRNLLEGWGSHSLPPVALPCRITWQGEALTIWDERAYTTYFMGALGAGHTHRHALRWAQERLEKNLCNKQIGGKPLDNV